MRILGAFFRRLCLCAVVAGLPFLSFGAGKPENVVLQYHFAGAAQLASNTNVSAAKKVFSLRSTFAFRYLVVGRLATNIAETQHFQTDPKAVALLRPLVGDILLSESMASVGGSPGKPLDFVLAVQLSKERSEIWQQDLQTLNNGPGEEFHAETFSGRRWKKGADGAFWVVPAGDWLLAGRGESLASVRTDYLQQIQKTGRPGPALGSNCFEADVDWPHLTNWCTLSSFPFKLGRTQIAISAEKGNFHMDGHVTYPEAIPWQPPLTTFPTNMVHEPLLSFVTGQNVEPFLKSDETLSRLCTNPFRDQYYFWSMRELAFQSYAAWPAINPSNTMMTLSAQAIDELNPKLQALDGTELAWTPKGSLLTWTKLQLIGPFVRTAPSNAEFLVAALFPLTKGTGPAPKALWDQIEGRTNLVYYDWELTGPRLKYLVTVTQVLPILQMLGVGPGEPYKVWASRAKPLTNAPGHAQVDPRLAIEEAWLVNLAPLLANTVTEVTRTSPTELTVVRNSPFIFDSLELVLLSHMLSDTPAGPLDGSLLPQAKMSGPGLPH